MATGIVLGGGGTLGDFQVGALKFLYEKSILPDIKCVCGTSIGAINAVIVSTGEGCDKRLERYWSDGVVGSKDLIPQHTWSETIDPMLKAFILAEKRSQLPMGRILALVSLSQEAKEGSFRDTISAVRALEQIFGNAVKESALYEAKNLKQRLQEKMDDIEKEKALNPSIIFSLYAVNIETGKKTCFTNDIQLADTRDDTLYVQCRSPSLLVQAALASAAVPVIFPPVEVCGSYYIDGSAREIVPISEAIRCGADEIYAILCLPRFAKRKYACLDLKDKEGRIVSTDWCTSNLLDIEPEDWVVNNRNWNPKSDDCDVLDIANRTAALLLDEMTEGDLVATDKTDKIATDKKGEEIKPTVIDPLIPVHGWTQLNIGLLKINADQGYMRAFDVICAEPASIYEQCEKLTAEITVRRIKIWALEHQLIKEWSEVRKRSQSSVKPLWAGSYIRHALHRFCADVVDTRVLRTIRQEKMKLKTCVEKRLAVVESSSLSNEDKKRSLPADYRAMYLCWEPHNWRVEGQNLKRLIPPTPWHQLDLGEEGSSVIEEDWSLGHLTDECKKPRSLLSFEEEYRQIGIE